MEDKEMDQLLNEKINRFSAIISDEANREREEIETKLGAEKEKRLSAKENEYLQEAYETIQADVELVKKTDNAKVLQEEIKARRELLRKREEIIDNVFSDVRERIDAFRQTGEYGEWLVKKTKDAVDEIGGGSVTVYVVPEDMKYAKKLAKAAKNVTVEETDEEGFIGGVKVKSLEKRVTADYSLGGLLSEQREGFLQTSGLAL